MTEATYRPVVGVVPDCRVQSAGAGELVGDTWSVIPKTKLSRSLNSAYSDDNL